MKMISVAVASAIALAAATSAAADGTPRKWRATHRYVPAYVRAGLSYNQITPYYVGYYPTHYSHYRPDPIPSGYSYRPHLYRDGCWNAFDGAIWWGC
jgi:hypothetical protein